VRKLRRHSHERFRSLVENACDGTTIIDDVGRILYQGPAVEHLLGYKPGEVTGRYITDLVCLEDVATATEKIRSCLESLDEVQTMRMRIRRRDGSLINVEAVGKRLGNSAPSPRVVINWRDVSEQLRFEEELARTRDAALTVSRSKFRLRDWAWRSVHWLVNNNRAREKDPIPPNIASEKDRTSLQD
jgi:PAS domain S-box-containing protein